MISWYTLWRIVWVVAGLFMMAYPFMDREASFAMCIYYNLWTIPFGTIWLYLIIDVLPNLNVEINPPLYLGSQLASLAIAYMFWFVWMPRIRTWARGRRKTAL